MSATGSVAQPAFRWFALQCKARSEAIVERQLTAASIETFFPTYRLGRAWRAASIVARPLFPGYLFAHIDLTHAEPRLWRRLPGLIGPVSFDGRPAPIPDEIIDLIRSRSAEVASAGGPALLNVRPGDAVRILEGPFKDLDAIFDGALDGKARVRVLLDVLGRLSRVELPAAFIAKSSR